MRFEVAAGCSCICMMNDDDDCESEMNYEPHNHRNLEEASEVMQKRNLPCRKDTQPQTVIHYLS